MIAKAFKRSERKRKQPAKLTESSDVHNFFTHVGMVVDVLWTEKDLDGTVERCNSMMKMMTKFLCFTTKIEPYIA